MVLNKYHKSKSHFKGTSKKKKMILYRLLLLIMTLNFPSLRNSLLLQL